MSKTSRITKVFAVLGWIVVGVVIGAAMVSLYERSISASFDGKQNQDEVWTCGMHPQVRESEPGSCPICKMDLVQASTPAHDHHHHTADSEWTCGMHPQVRESEPGSCPICKMDLVEAAPAHPTGSSHGGQWTCPMHPEVVEDGPASCPICKMDLVESDEPSKPAIYVDPHSAHLMNVRTETARYESMDRTVRAVGTLDYDQERMVTVTPKFSGFVEKVYVNYVGESVRAGDPLFEVYSPELVQTEQELLSAISYVERMKAAPEAAQQRAKELLQAARTRLSYWDVTEEQIDRLEREGRVFRTVTIYAPSDGVVMKRMDGLDGMAISPGMEVMHIADLSTLWATVEVFEEQLAWIRPGERAELRMDYDPASSIEGRVLFAEPELSPQTRAGRLTLRIPNREGMLRVGMFAEVLFQPEFSRRSLTVPSGSVIRTGKRDVVFVHRDDDHYEPREVRLGHKDDGRVEVLDGLVEGERVVTSAQFLLDSESSLAEAIARMTASSGSN